MEKRKIKKKNLYLFLCKFYKRCCLIRFISISSIISCHEHMEYINITIMIFFSSERWRDRISEGGKNQWSKKLGGFSIHCKMWVSIFHLWEQGVALEEASWMLCKRSSHLLVFICACHEDLQDVKEDKVFMSYLAGTAIFRNSSPLHFCEEDWTWLSRVKVMSSLGSD